MPTKRPRKSSKRRTFKRRRTSYGRVNRPLGMRQAVYRFKRSLVYDVDLKSNYGLPGSILCSDGKGIVWNFSIALSNLPNFSEFTSLFQQYKLTGASFKIYPVWSNTATTGNTQTDPTSGSVTHYPGASNFLMRTKFDRAGRALTAASTEESWLEMQATKTSTLPSSSHRPLKRYMRLNQLAQLYSGGITDDYSVTYPRFVSVDEPDTPHYGLQFRFDTCGGTIASQPINSGKFKMEICVYLTCKAVK